MTSYEMVIKKSVAKFLDKLEKSTPREYSKIIVFLNEKLSKVIILASCPMQSI